MDRQRGGWFDVQGSLLHICIAYLLQIAVLHGWGRRRPIHHTCVGTIARLLEEDLLAEVGDALPGCAARVGLLTGFPLVSLDLAQD